MAQVLKTCGLKVLKGSNPLPSADREDEEVRLISQAFNL